MVDDQRMEDGEGRPTAELDAVTTARHVERMASRGAVLIVLCGADVGRIIRLDAGTVTLGRDERCEAAIHIVVDGMRTRANIRTAVRAIEANHDLRMEATDYILGVLDRHGGQMSPELRDSYLVTVLRVLDAGFYVMPWERLLPGG